MFLVHFDCHINCFYGPSWFNTALLILLIKKLIAFASLRAPFGESIWWRLLVVNFNDALSLCNRAAGASIASETAVVPADGPLSFAASLQLRFPCKRTAGQITGSVQTDEKARIVKCNMTCPPPQHGCTSVGSRRFVMMKTRLPGRAT